MERYLMYNVSKVILEYIYQMIIWAKERHQKYLDQFPDYPKNRKRLFPFIW